MYLAILCIFALSLGDNATAFSHRIDDVILKFIVDATPTLFPPLRISMYLCSDYGKMSEFMCRTKFFKNIDN